MYWQLYVIFTGRQIDIQYFSQKSFCLCIHDLASHLNHKTYLKVFHVKTKDLLGTIILSEHLILYIILFLLFISFELHNLLLTTDHVFIICDSLGLSDSHVLFHHHVCKTGSQLQREWSPKLEATPFTCHSSTFPALLLHKPSFYNFIIIFIILLGKSRLGGGMKISFSVFSL